MRPVLETMRPLFVITREERKHGPCFGHYMFSGLFRDYMSSLHAGCVYVFGDYMYSVATISKLPKFPRLFGERALQK